VTIRHLLTHSSGLPSWRPLYKEAATPDTALAIIYATPLDTVPDARMVYSDLGAILLGKVVERVSGEPLDVYLTRHVTGPLGMTSTMYRPDASLRDRVAPTEFDPWRQRHIRGEVHDENAFMLGGVSGHAGLFSTASDLTRFARMLLGGGTLDGVRILRPATIAQFTAVQDPGLSHRALGWETPTGQNSAGHRLSARAFGHTGFTGTSLWIDPERGAFVLLLTNRVNPSRQNTRIGLVRVALADAAMAALDGAAAPLTPSTP
jgi:CubicO group peptidase (beta-lactamase class C family)